ncbi:MAG: hypothetical protein ABSA39_12805 [Edaphobacter sp.]
MSSQRSSQISRLYRFGIPVFVIWLISWAILSWPGMQDDALIHLRYADNLLRTHHITYDGVHSNYGASSLLYVGLLAFLRIFSHSPNLPRLVSSCAHLLLFAGLVTLFLRFVPAKSNLARLLGLVMLFILVSPSAVRWLDDGMETGIAIIFVALICWTAFSESSRNSITPARYLAFAAIGFLAVLLRIELILLCGIAFAMLIATNLFDPANPSIKDRFSKTLLRSSHLLVGGILALVFIRIEMHFLLPDTALAKSSGIPNLHDAVISTAIVFAGAPIFGAGLFLFWILTFILLLRTDSFSISTLSANSIFPILFAAAALRGQLIQGTRYFAWTFVFSILWNILALGRVSPNQQQKPQKLWAAYGFIAILLLALPYEVKAMYPVLTERADLARKFENQHLEIFQDKRGIALDIGYIGYFSRADICDLGNLVNGRDKARLDLDTRIKMCIAEKPDFLFLSPGVLDQMRQHSSLEDWKACDTFDFRNVSSVDSHHLLVPSANLEACKKATNSISR